MRMYLNNTIGRLRLLGFLEGFSLLALLFIAMPLKYMWGQPMLVKIIGSLHGGLFLMYVFYVMYAGLRYKWKFWRITWQLLLASVVPFGTFYVDSRILRKMQEVPAT